jgi:hypothetical protein
MLPWKYRQPSQNEIDQITGWAHRSRLQYHVKIGVIPQTQADFMMRIYSPNSVSYQKLFKESEKRAAKEEQKIRFTRRVDKALKRGSIDAKFADSLRALPTQEAEKELSIAEGLMGNWLSIDQARLLRRFSNFENYYQTAMELKREADKEAQIHGAMEKGIVTKQAASALRKLPIEKVKQRLEIARARHSGRIDEETAQLLSMMDSERYRDAMGAIESERQKDESVVQALNRGLIDGETAHRLRITIPPRVKLELEVLEDGRKGILTLKETEGLLWTLDVMGPVVAGEIHRDLVRARAP